MAKKRKRAKRKDPYKYKKTIINRLIKENREEIVQGYFESKDQTVPKFKKDQKIALEAFKKDVKGVMLNQHNKELTASQLFNKVLNTEKFTSKESRLLENFYETQKKFFNYTFTREYTNKKENITYMKSILMPTYKRDQIEFDEEMGLYKVKYGKDAGKYFVFIHTPGQEPSFKLEVWEAEDVRDAMASGQSLNFD